MRPVRSSPPRRGPRVRISSDPNRRIRSVLPVARPSAAVRKMVSTIRRASARVTPPWKLRTAAARSALFNVETCSVLPFVGGREDLTNCTAVGGERCAGWRGRRTHRWRAGTGTPTSGRHRLAERGEARIVDPRVGRVRWDRRSRASTPLRELGWPLPVDHCARGRCAVPLGSAQRCRPEVGVPSRPRGFARVGVRRCAGLGTARAGPHRENWPEVGVPWPVRHARLVGAGLRG